MSGRTWQDMPGWLPSEVRRSHARALAAGQVAAGDDAVSAITDRVLAEDPEFARVLVARFVGSMVRAAPAAGARREDDKQRRKAAARQNLAGQCADLRAAGLGLREIGRMKGISHQTVANLIAEHLMHPDTTRQSGPSKIAPVLTADFDGPDVTSFPKLRLA